MISGTAGGVQVGGDEAAARLQVGEQRRALGDPVEVVDLQLDAGLAGDREQVQHPVGRAAGGADAGDRVLQRLAGDDPARPQVLGEQAHRELADSLRDLVLGRVLGRHHRRAAGRDPERLEGTGHRVGGELAAAGAGAGAGDVLEAAKVLLAHLPRFVGADRLEDVEDRHVAAAPATGAIEPP